MELHFATGNGGKVREVREILGDLDVSVDRLDVDVMEPQDADLVDIARLKVDQAVEASQLHGAYVMADDSGLFVDALDGFPGILSSPFDAQVGRDRLLRLLDGDDPRDAAFRAVIALFDPATGEIRTFAGRCEGSLVEPRGDGGFGYDPLFVPDGHDRTFAEDVEHKHEVSHRREALEGLRDWIADRTA